MVGRIVVVLLLAVAAFSYEEEEEHTKPITCEEFEKEYHLYIKGVEKCHNLKKEERDRCLEKVQGDFRPHVRRAIECNVIEEISCQKGKFGTFEMIIKGGSIEVQLPC